MSFYFFHFLNYFSNLSNKIQLLTKDMEKEKSKLSSLETTKKFHEYVNLIQLY